MMLIVIELWFGIKIMRGCIKVVVQCIKTCILSRSQNEWSFAIIIMKKKNCQENLHASLR